MQGKDQWFDLSIDFHEFQVFGRDQDGRYQTSGYGELRVSISRLNIINSIIWNSGRSLFQVLPWRLSSNIETLIEEIKPIVRGAGGG